jgi:hypothetical protein
MELLETDDPIKGQLLRKSAHHREQLQEDARMISEKTEKIITNAIIIGGALAVTYYLVSRFGTSKEKKKSKTAKLKIIQEPRGEEAAANMVSAEPQVPGIMATIGTALASQATVFLLDLAKEKLGDFMAAQMQKQSKTNEPS